MAIEKYAIDINCFDVIRDVQDSFMQPKLVANKLKGSTWIQRSLRRPVLID